MWNIVKYQAKHFREIFHEILLWNNVIYCEIFIIFLITVNYCKIWKIFAGQYFRDFTIFYNIYHISQYCTLYCTAPVCRWQPGARPARTRSDSQCQPECSCCSGSGWLVTRERNQFKLHSLFKFACQLQRLTVNLVSNDGAVPARLSHSKLDCDHDRSVVMAAAGLSGLLQNKLQLGLYCCIRVCCSARGLPLGLLPPGQSLYWFSIIKFSLTSSLPTKCIVCPLFQTLPRPPPSVPPRSPPSLPSLLRHGSQGLRQHRDSRAVEMHRFRTKKIVVLVTIAVVLLPSQTQPMVDDYLGTQSRTGWGPFIFPAKLSSCWQADRKWLAQSNGT